MSEEINRAIKNIAESAQEGAERVNDIHTRAINAKKETTENRANAHILFYLLPVFLFHLPAPAAQMTFPFISSFPAAPSILLSMDTGRLSPRKK